MTNSTIQPGTLVKRPKAWLITWEWSDESDKVPDSEEARQGSVKS